MIQEYLRSVHDISVKSPKSDNHESGVRYQVLACQVSGVRYQMSDN